MSNRIPFLLSNVEVMNILQNRIHERNNSSSNNNKNGANNNNNHSQQQHQNNRKLRHRDWIEDNVIQYCQATSQLQNCTKAYELDTILTRHKNTTVTLENTIDPLMETKKQKSLTTTNHNDDGKVRHDGNDNGNDSNPLLLSTATGTGTLSSSSMSSVQYTGFGLTDAESIQIVNYAPTEIVEIHLMIEELQSRFTDNEQEVLLKIISKFTTTTNNVDNSDTNIATEENDVVHDREIDDNNNVTEDIVYEDYEINEPIVESHFNDNNNRETRPPPQQQQQQQQQLTENDNSTKKRIKLEGNETETNGTVTKRVKTER
jgi:RNA polymerase Rpb4